LGGRGQSGERAVGLVLRGAGLVAGCDQPAPGFGQRRDTRHVACEVALSRGMQVALVVGLALRGAPLFASGALTGRRGADAGLRGLDRLATAFDFGAGDRELAVDIGEAAALGETPRRAGWRMSV